MRATTLLNAVLDLPGVTVIGVAVPAGGGEPIAVRVRLRRRQLSCPSCGYSTRSRWDTRPVWSRWRHLDAFRCRVMVYAVRRRLRCPEHGVVTEAVPFARARSEFTRDFEDVTAFWATKTDKSTISRALRIDWDTVGRICQRVVDDDRLDADRLNGLVRIGVDEVSWKKQFNFLTLVTDHDRKRIVWGTTGKDTDALNRFFAELGADRAAQLQTVSLDMGPAFLRSVYHHAQQATLCTDPFHAVQRVSKALDIERRRAFTELKTTGDPIANRTYRGVRWALLKNPDKLTDTQAATLRQIKRRGGDLWRAYTLKEAFRALFAGDLTTHQTTELLDRWLSRASRSRLPAFVAAAKTIRTFRLSLIAAIDLGINNARAEGLNNVVRLIIRRAHGFHSPQAALALIMLTCGPITLHLPHERANPRTG